MKKIAYKMYLRFRRMKQRNGAEVLHFTKILSRVNTVLVICQGDVNDHTACFEFLLNLAHEEKRVTVLMSSLANYNELTYHEIRKFDYHETEFGLFGLPKKTLKNRLKATSFDMIVDLNYTDYSPLSLLGLYPSSKYRVGFDKMFKEQFYNFIHNAGSGDAGNLTKLFELIKNI